MEHTTVDTVPPPFSVSHSSHHPFFYFHFLFHLAPSPPSYSYQVTAILFSFSLSQSEHLLSLPGCCQSAVSATAGASSQCQGYSMACMTSPEGSGWRHPCHAGYQSPEKARREDLSQAAHPLTHLSLTASLWLHPARPQRGRGEAGGQCSTGLGRWP